MAKSADSVEKKLKDFVALMRARYNIYAVVLYGSYAEGRANDDLRASLLPVMHKRQP
jgi:predicted nucleotidyltransferase